MPLNHVVDLTASLSEDDGDDKAILKLQNLLENGSPIVVWITLELKEPKLTDVWHDINNFNVEISWISPEHCALVVGYTPESFVVNDPHTGKVEYLIKQYFDNFFD